MGFPAWDCELSLPGSLTFGRLTEEQGSLQGEIQKNSTPHRQGYSRIPLLAFQKPSPDTISNAKEEVGHARPGHFWPQSGLAEDASRPQALAQPWALNTEGSTVFTKTSCPAVPGSGRGSRG